MRQSVVCSLGSKEGPPNGDFVTKAQALSRLAYYRHHAGRTKVNYLNHGGTGQLESWGRREKELFEYERTVFALYSPSELFWYVKYQWLRAKCWQPLVPLLVWWYGNKAERAFEQYCRTKTGADLRSWAERELKVSFASGVSDMHFSFDPEAPTPDPEERLRAVCGVLRMVRTMKDRVKLTSDDVKRGKD